MHLPLGLLSHLSSLLSFLNNNTKKIKKLLETSHKKFSEGKQAHVGMEALKTNQTNVPTMCTPQNSLHALSLFIRMH